MAGLADAFRMPAQWSVRVKQGGLLDLPAHGRVMDPDSFEQVQQLMMGPRMQNEVSGDQFALPQPQGFAGTGFADFLRNFHLPRQGL